MVMQGMIKSVYIVRQKHVKRGFVGAFVDFCKGDFAGYETAQEKQREREENLTAALADATVMKTYIGENFRDFLNGVGIHSKAVPTLKDADAA